MQKSHRKYLRVTNSEREEMSRELARGEGYSAIAERLGRSVSAISREINRNSGETGYRAFSAGRQAAVRASSRRHGKRRLLQEERLRIYVLEKLRTRWSPEEIVKRLNEEYPLDTTMRISHETIYRYIYVLPRGVLKRVQRELNDRPRAVLHYKKPDEVINQLVALKV